jgi:MFS family permease
MHKPIRNVLILLILGFALIGIGFALMMSLLDGPLKPSAAVALTGLALMGLGVIVILFGLARFAFRKPDVAELAGAAEKEPRSWHFTRFGLAYLLVMLFGLPALALLELKPEWLLYTLMGLGYLVFALGFLIPAFTRVFFYRTLPRHEITVTPKPVDEYYAPLIAFAFLGLAALAAVIAFTFDDPKQQRVGYCGIVMGVVGFICCVVPPLRRRVLGPRT